MDASPASRVTDALRKLLDEGLPQEESVLDFMLATHGDTSPGAFREVLDDAGSPEAATLAGLLLFPGESVSARLEPVLTAARCTPEEAGSIAEALEGAVTRTAALLPGGVRVPLDLEPGTVRTFVARLRLEKTPPREISRILDELYPAGIAASLSSFLRHCRLEWAGPRVAFVHSLLGGLAPREDHPASEAGVSTGACLRGGQGRPDTAEILAWAVIFLDTLPPDAQPLDRLGRKHAELSGLVRRAAEFHKALAGSSFEVMMSQGARMSLPHPDAVRHELAVLDAVCLAVAGVPAWTLAGAAESDLGAFEDGESLIAALGE